MLNDAVSCMGSAIITLSLHCLQYSTKIASADVDNFDVFHAKLAVDLRLRVQDMQDIHAARV